jgi:hypothetical protein
MDTKDMLLSMWKTRHTHPEIFIKKEVPLFSSTGQFIKNFTILSKSRRVTVYPDENTVISGTDRVGILIYADQNPLGYSEDAHLVEQGKKRPDEIGWLFIKMININLKIWLGKVSSGIPTILQDCEYNKEKSHLLLK